MRKTQTVFVAGSQTLLGGALVRRLESEPDLRLVGTSPHEPDLTDARAVQSFFRSERPRHVYLAAGKSGGIRANQQYPADLMIHNLLVASHVISAAHEHGAEKLLYLASSCSYPRQTPQPMRIESLWSGRLEPTNEAYATAKLAGLTLCQAYRAQYGRDFISVIPANGFGIGDDFDPLDAHVIPALLARMHEAKLEGQDSLTIWGTGRARREFVFADDLADGCLFLMRHYSGAAPINLGGGSDQSIGELALAIKEVVGFEGELQFDADKPDGMPLKALDSRPLAELGWTAATPFHDALTKTYAWYLRHRSEGIPTHA